MKIIDLVKTSQKNLVRAKLRTFLTVLAVFVGTFTISVTTGVGNGVKAYVNKELGNVGVENAFVVQPKQTQSNPLSSNVVKYDPNRTTGNFNMVLLTDKDIENIKLVKNVQKVIPNYASQIEYISAGSSDKYVASASQYIDGFNLDMAAGRVVNNNFATEVTIPIRYVQPLGFKSANNAVGQNLVVGYKTSSGQIEEKVLTVVGVQQESVLGSSSIYITPTIAQEIQIEETKGIANLEGTYQAVLVEFDKNLSQTQRDELKAILQANNYTAATIQDQIGTFSKIINGILAGLDTFGVVALLVATFGIVNTLLMAVNERTSEIGLMKALGANSRTVFGIFSLEAMSIGFWGALIGIGLSVGAGTILNKYASTHFLKDFVGFDLLTFPILSLLAILAGIVLLAFLAGALPSLKASRLDPIKALRYE
jgi:putative ABC transport system permease protein